MSEARDDDSYWDLVVNEAARDPQLQAVIDFALKKGVNTDVEPVGDGTSLARDLDEITRRYGLRPEDFDRAWAIGQRLIERSEGEQND
mgnify:CR=1 FL=1